MEIGIHTKITGIFGHPICHSLSPLMHNAAFKKLGLNYIYLPFDIKPKDLKKAIEAIKHMNFTGVNITIPYKEKVMQFLDRVDSEAELIGAVNTVKNVNGELVGFNTDGRGLVESLKKDFNFNPKGKNIFIIGAGGAARGILGSLAFRGAKIMYLSNRTFSRAEKLANEFCHRFPSVEFSVLPLENNILKYYFKNADILINTTSAGMNRDSLKLPLCHLPESAIVYDIVYNPVKTPLVREAEKMGFKARNGLGMLVFQGALSFEIWTDTNAPVEFMEETLIKKRYGKC